MPKVPALYHVTVKQLQLAPGQQSEQIFRQVLGCCQTIVEGIGALRNRLSDAHGKGKNPARPTPRHAELAVNLAGTMATFLIGSWQARERDAKGEQSV